MGSPTHPANPWTATSWWCASTPRSMKLAWNLPSSSFLENGKIPLKVIDFQTNYINMFLYMYMYIYIYIIILYIYIHTGASTKIVPSTSIQPLWKCHGRSFNCDELDMLHEPTGNMWRLRGAVPPAWNASLWYPLSISSSHNFCLCYVTLL